MEHNPSSQTPFVRNGRPEDAAGRLPKELYTYDLLDSLSIPYLQVDHEAAYTIENCHDVDRVLKIEICKNLFLCNSQKTNFYLLLMPGHKKFRTADVSKQIGSSRLSFAGPDDLLKYLGLTPGSVSVLGLMNDTQNRVNLLIDREVAESEYLGCHPCINTSSLKLKTRDVLEKFLPEVAHGYRIVEL